MEMGALLKPELWVDMYADQLYRFTISRMNDRGLAEDIVQETFLSAWKARKDYTGVASEKNWLFAICKNKILDHYRRKATHAALDEPENDHLYFDAADHWTAAMQPSAWKINDQLPIENREFHAVLSRCRSKLKEMQNAVFSMKYIDDLRSEEVCAQLGISAANYWVLLHRAKLQLRACLEKNWINR
jgi:RNA polymerase sigma-70 factor (TIGR02943 family)